MTAARFTLRPYLPADATTLIDIFRASIDELAAEDYGEAQREAWAAQADDGEAFATRFATTLTLVALESGAPAGFVVLKGRDALDMLYVDPRSARQGVATLLVDAVEKLAGARGAEQLSVDSSDTARDLFAKRGYEAQRRNTVLVGDEWLSNTTMRKRLAANSNVPAR